ncbi:Nitrogen permease regulator 3 [Coemansia sp. RSA 1813]|nr:Nitrogen permease regulator 3 [Coemansia sp. RSA 1646]KAJ1768930.1 Nitrogen permease regulator 3 [Coemansia sp. RSA 1843]KAJ2087675.1 Nitrogen permease regulator 3 [Coemansia sp. RSA 986]KAJ2212618.1 Nitrogen permease regulator 3 [Coemansia sp. RSA 487]KAJ2567040.1 Nitrogen permease regulator 3 [Coemansia sp. RSA 1813]
MHEGDAILGIFLATYSSKGDYLPLRYPLSQFDYEYAESALRAAADEETRKRNARKERFGTSGNTTIAGGAAAASSERKGGGNAGVSIKDSSSTNVTNGSVAQAGEGGSAISADSYAPDLESGKAPPSRNASYTSVTNASSSTSKSTVSGQTNLAALTSNQNQALPYGTGTSKHKKDSKTESRQAGGEHLPSSSSDTRAFTDDQLVSGDMSKDASHHPYMTKDTHGFDTKFLAQLFSPRPSMSDRRFQVAIDNVLFVGHPLRDDPKEKVRDPDYYDAEQDDDETMLKLASIAEQDGWKVRSDIMMSHGSNQQGTKLLADLGLMNLMLSREPSETGDSTISEGERAVRDSREWKRRGYLKRVYPKLFNIVFMLDNTYPGVECLADRLYEDVLKRLTKALMIEQMDSNYVMIQSRLIRQLNDAALSESYTSARYIQKALRISTLATDLIRLYNGLRKGGRVCLHVHKRIMLSLQIPRGPRLDRPLPIARPRPFLNTGYNIAGYSSTTPANTSTAASATHTPRPTTPADGTATAAAPETSQATQSIAPAVENYSGPLFFSKDAHLSDAKNGVGDCNGHASLDANILSSKQSLFMAGEKLTARNGCGSVVADSELHPGEYNRYPRIEPFHAILLLDTMENIRNHLLYSDVSPTLLTLIDAIQPTRALSTLHNIIDCSYAQLCRLVAHLVYWNIARLICPIKMAYTYVPAVTRITREISGKFRKKSFQLCTLPQLFAAMHPPRPISQVFEALVASATSCSDDNAGAVALGFSGNEETRNAKAHVFRAELQDMLAFLLSEEIIAQYHTWPVVLVPNYVKYNLSEEQFMRLSIAWFRSLHTEHPDLLGAYPQALLDKAEFECWCSDELREQADMELVEQASREAEHKAMLCRVMRKLALRRMRDIWEAKKRGKHGRRLREVEQQMAEEEDKIHAFCNRIERERMEAWILAKSQRDSVLERTRLERIQSRRSCGRGIPDDSVRPGKDTQLHKWYSFVQSDPVLGDLAKEITQKYVSFVPADDLAHRTEAEKVFMDSLVQGKPANLQDWFIRHSHLFTGKTHLVKLLESEQASIARVESILREFEGIIHLPQHV